MSFQIQVLLDGQQAGTPFNLDEIEIELLFDKDAPQARVNDTQWTFVNEDAQKINNHIDAGSIFQAMGLTLRLTDGNPANDTDFEQLLDFTQDHLLSCNRVFVTAIDRGGIDWISRNIDSFTFEYLYRESGVISEDDFVFVPYVRNKKGSAVDQAILYAQIFYMSMELSHLIAEIIADIGQMATVIDIPEVIELIAKIIYAIILFAAIVKMLIDLFDLIIQPVKYHAGMYVRDLFQKGCEHLGLEFESSILNDPDSAYYNLFHLPSKYIRPDTSNEKVFGFLLPNRNEQNGVFQGTFGDMVRTYAEMFNAKLDVRDGKLRFERRDWVDTTATYQIPSVEVEESKKNSDELISTYIVQWQTDSSDLNTYDEYEGTITQVDTVIPSQFIADRDRLIGGGAEIRNIDLSHGRQKKEFNLNERLFNALIKAVNPLVITFRAVANGGISAINFIGNSIEKLNKVFSFVGLTGIQINFPDIPPIPTLDVQELVDRRLRMLKLEDDVVSIPKAFILDPGGNEKDYRINEFNDTTMSSETLFNGFHQIELFAETGNELQNQWVRYSIPTVKFCYEDFLKVYRNSLILDENGDEARIESLKWNPVKQKASIDYRVRQVYATQFNQTINTPDGK